VYEAGPTAEVLIEDGVQVPFTPSVDFAGKSGAVANWQMAAGSVGKVGTRLLTVVILINTLDAQVFDVGINE
jgi:hypothetical protein